MEIEATYISEWSEGSVSTQCNISLRDCQITDVSASDEADHYTILKRELVEVEWDGGIYQFEASDGKLTAKGKSALESKLSEFMLPAIAITERDQLIARLCVSVNKRHGSSLSNEEVAHYVGSDTTTSLLTEWVTESENNLPTAVTASDILDSLD